MSPGESAEAVEQYPCIVEYENEVILRLRPDENGWQFRAVRVGKGVEVTRNDRFHGWMHYEDTRAWGKALKRLATRTENAWSEKSLSHFSNGEQSS